jgi:hypothetical protein
MATIKPNTVENMEDVESLYVPGNTRWRSLYGKQYGFLKN